MLYESNQFIHMKCYDLMACERTVTSCFGKIEIGSKLTICCKDGSTIGCCSLARLTLALGAIVKSGGIGGMERQCCSNLKWPMLRGRSMMDCSPLGGEMPWMMDPLHKAE